MKLYTRITLLTKLACTLCIVLLCSVNSWSQQTDSIHISLKSRTKKTSRIPEIKANITPYKPLFMTVGGSGMFGTSSTSSTVPKTATVVPKDKLLSIIKIYPNPVEDQLNIILAIGKDGTQTTIKIIDLLGNEVATLLNERLNAGELTKNFVVPNRINPGIYFLRVIAGSESQVKRISVL
ncbi:Por secretion system C-terminal sorting domain-containing protein [Pedobacter terrae]|uniref:Por secretion system C-terminal sorting domain-containing protein n=1 Tax=Pedobacter terrae TaxID=405671 RepID=A0A1G7YEJ9_9SPHI|nr:T9SS type A sorting domain-containing protein [Pedobacter terrae]SDG94350.1 Por secretion system C-terminal sorting domain-containing protein [Pedobacter terrae]